MSGKQNDDFFNDLDKTADLLKTFKPSVEESKDMGLDEIEKLYKALEKRKELEEKEKLEKQRKLIDSRQLEASEIEKIQKSVNTKLEKESQKEKIEPSSKEETLKEKKKNNLSNDKTIEDSPKTSSSNKSSEKEKSLKSGKEEPIKEKRVLTKEEKIARLKAKKKRERELLLKQERLKEKQLSSKETKKDVAKTVNKKVTKRKLKKGVIELVFCACSFLFMVTCVIIYGMRLIKYYKIYNPKNDSGEVLALMTTEIAKNSSIVYEGEGLYMQGGDYVYKGSNVNNYVEFGNLLWRIIKSNADGTMDIILDDYINVLPFSKEYSTYIESDIHKWLNEYFLNYLDKEYLTGTKICLDTVSDLNSYSCNTSNTDSYVRIMSVKEYLNSKVENATYVGNIESTLWLSTVSNDGAWQINGNNLSVASETRALGIKPVVTLRVGVALLDGDGTKENPYKIEKEKNEIQIGDYIKLGNDIYVVYNNQNNQLSLALNGVLPTTYRFDINTNIYNMDTMYSLAYYLNNSYYNSLSYKDLILEKEWNTGVYMNSYQDIKDSTLTAKVGLLDLQDLKFNNEINSYFLLTGENNLNYLYGNELITSKSNISRSIRPCITINNGKIISGEGSLQSPYVVEG